MVLTVLLESFFIFLWFWKTYFFVLKIFQKSLIWAEEHTKKQKSFHWFWRKSGHCFVVWWTQMCHTNPKKVFSAKKSIPAMVLTMTENIFIYLWFWKTYFFVLKFFQKALIWAKPHVKKEKSFYVFWRKVAIVS